MSDAFGFGKFVPGFDFLQNLSKSATQAAPAAGAIPGMASWVAPTLSIEEIDKRIQELKSVLFWLEQNTTALKASIQAMEVQKMTLSTLQSMNVNMSDLAKAFTAKPPTASAAADASAASIFSAKPAPAPAPEPTAAPEAPSAQTPPEAPAAAVVPEAEPEAAAKPAVDPMQWWGALTQQFQDIASAAMKDVASEAMKAGMVAKNAATSAAKSKTGAAKAAPKSATKTSPTAKSAARPAAGKKAAPAKSAAKTVARKAPAKKRPAA
jgi:hypothetical protein